MQSAFTLALGNYLTYPLAQTLELALVLAQTLALSPALVLVLGLALVIALALVVTKSCFIIRVCSQHKAVLVTAVVPLIALEQRYIGIALWVG